MREEEDVYLARYALLRIPIFWHTGYGPCPSHKQFTTVQSESPKNETTIYKGQVDQGVV